MRYALLPRKKFIRKEQERRYEVPRNVEREHSRMSFNRVEEASRSLEEEIAEEMKKQGAD